ncbi:MAG: 4a-hydroxytetrahydrobiopterin dehydratase [Candidatus Viridilinea halotolerans]|uniref:Putative pterin-4-alpha-carbinolamine dehydratase n=1 Tax=Candidatus Viridilinea halotolerans TaxID=2491704 RepID=A0A426TX37_9CHLR|nr:MAG: 4a-hydroxytetrahydrobiopterin dehydratase [Candidatus Viridilinea halotolerans]
MSKLNPDEIAQQFEGLSGWRLQDATLSKTYKLSGFPAAIAFVTHVAFLAEAAGHHPDIDIRYNKVTLTLTTHDAGGLTAKDFALAAAADEAMG